jgi:hypothetical protein
VALSPDGKQLAVGGTEDKGIRVWNMETGKREHLLDGHSIFALAFSPDGKTLAAHGTDGRVVLWDVAKNKALVTLQMPGRTDKVDPKPDDTEEEAKEKSKWYMVLGGYSLDGRTLATGCGDGTIRLWPVPVANAGRTPSSQVSAAAQAQTARTAPKGLAAPADDAKKQLFTGRVTGADGKAVAGVEVALLGDPASNRPDFVGLDNKGVLAHGRADGEGKFRLSVHDATLARYRAVYVIAGKARHGLAWGQANLKAPAQETVVRLASEKTVRGRLVNVQGQPAAGVRVRVKDLYSQEPQKEGRRFVFVGALPPNDFPAWPGPATTGKDGKFALGGLSQTLGGFLEMDGEEYAIGRAGLNPGKENANQEINLTLAPAQFLDGVVTAADTGKPVPGAKVVCSEVRCRADEKGHYRLRMPADRPEGAFGPKIKAFPPEGEAYFPYLHREAVVKWPKGAVKHRLDLSLARGVVVRGTVTEAGQGKPITGAVVVVSDPNPEVDYPGHVPQVSTRQDGTFALPVRPDHQCHLLVKGPNNDYIPAEITSGELSGGKRVGYRAYPDAVIPVKAKAGTGTVDVTAKLRRGVTIRGKLVAPGDKPVGDVVMGCWNQVSVQFGGLGRTNVPIRDGSFELRGCDPEETYPVYFLDARNKLGAVARLSAKEAAGQEVTVRLERCGSAVVRFADKEGKPRKGFLPIVWLVVRPGSTPASGSGVHADADLIGNLDPVNYVAGPRVDAQGRCSLPVLIPGATYLVSDVTSIREDYPKKLTVKPGESLNMNFVTEPQQ